MSKACFLCKSEEQDDLAFGKLYTKWRLHFHYYCLLLSSNLVQSGRDDRAGIYGFMQPDIRKEEARIQKNKCYICKKSCANIACCSKKCFRSFHTVCGARNGCLSHFVDTFQSWCASHAPLPDEGKHSDADVCAICYDSMGPYNRVESIRAPCCLNGWFHRRCVSHFAQTAGYFFKCPLCNNKEMFGQSMLRRGVYIPEKDAEWELEPMAYQEQLQRPSSCDAQVCRCRYGREFDNKTWDLLICEDCGSTCRHHQCLDKPAKSYQCQMCQSVANGFAARADNAETVKSDEEDDAEEKREVENVEHESGIHDTGSCDRQSSDSPVIRRATRKLLVSEDDTDSEASITWTRRRKQRCNTIMTDSDDEHSSVQEANIMKYTSQELKPLVQLQRLSSEQILSLTSGDSGSEATSSTIIDYHCRSKKPSFNRSPFKRTPSGEGLRSDTDCLSSSSKETKPSLKRPVSLSSDSDSDIEPKRRRIGPPRISERLNGSNEENVNTINRTETEQRRLGSTPPPSPASPSDTCHNAACSSSEVKRPTVQTSIVNFMKRTPPADSQHSSAKASTGELATPNGTQVNMVSSAIKRRPKFVPRHSVGGSTRKLRPTLDHLEGNQPVQRNLWDYYNRC